VAPAAPVLTPDIADDYRAPTVITGGGGWILYLELGFGEGILRAVSQDGRSWSLDPTEPVLRPAADWEEGRVAAPSAVVGPDGYPWLYYEYGNGAGVAAVRAADADGATFPSDAASRQPVLTVAQAGSELLWRNVTRVRSPFVLLDRDFEGTPLFRLYFSARGYESPQASSFGTVEQIPSNYSIGYAASADGLTFEPYPYNPIYDRIYPNTFVNHASELSPAVLRVGQETLLYYAAANRHLGEWENLRVAVNPPLFGR
jgi:hypothetical protein